MAPTTLSPRSSLDCPPRLSSSRSDRPTWGPVVAEIAAELGQPLMPWQRHVADVALEYDPETKLPRFRDVVLTVPRQSGKSTLILALIVHRAIMFGGPQRVAYAAQTRLDAKKKLIDDWLPIIDRSAFGRLMRPLKSSGEESFRWDNGSLTYIVANTEKAGHGATLDLGIVDEAFSQVDDRMDQAFKPAMITRRQSQMWTVSTAGTADSVYLNSKVESGRNAVDDPDSRMAYFEWSADPAAEPAQPQTWWSCMPALGHTVTEDAVAAEFENMNLSEFKRAYLNIPTVAALHDPVFDLDLWQSLADPASQLVGQPWFAVDVNPDRSSARIAVYGLRADGIEHAELLCGPGDPDKPGTDLEKRLIELHTTYGSTITLDPSGAAGSLLPALEAAGVPVNLIGMRDMTAACGGLFDAVTQKQMRHLDQPDLNSAVVVARKRELAGAWAWQKREGDICGLVAVTLARHSWDTLGRLVEPTVAFL